MIYRFPLDFLQLNFLFQIKEKCKVSHFAYSLEKTRETNRISTASDYYLHKQLKFYNFIPLCQIQTF